MSENSDSVDLFLVLAMDVDLRAAHDIASLAFGIFNDEVSDILVGVLHKRFDLRHGSSLL